MSRTIIRPKILDLSFFLIVEGSQLVARLATASIFQTSLYQEVYRRVNILLLAPKHFVQQVIFSASIYIWREKVKRQQNATIVCTSLNY